MSCVSHCLGRLCVALKIIALITNITALGLPYWYKSSPTTSSGVDGSNTVETTIREGLWKKCTDLKYVSSSNSFCDDNEATTVILAIRWILIVACGIIGIAILASGAAFLESNKTAYIVGAVHSFISVALNATSAALYATKVKDDLGFELKHLYIGWGLNFLSLFTGLLGALLALCLTRMVGNKKVEDEEK